MELPFPEMREWLHFLFGQDEFEMSLVIQAEMPSRQLDIWQSLKFEREFWTLTGIWKLLIYIVFKSEYHMIYGI